MAPPIERAGKKMLKMKEPPGICMKTKGKRKWKTIDPAISVKIKVLPVLHDMFMIYKELAVIFHPRSAGQGQTLAVSVANTARRGWWRGQNLVAREGVTTRWPPAQSGRKEAAQAARTTARRVSLNATNRPSDCLKKRQRRREKSSLGTLWRNSKIVLWSTCNSSWRGVRREYANWRRYASAGHAYVSRITTPLLRCAPWQRPADAATA